LLDLRLTTDELGSVPGKSLRHPIHGVGVVVDEDEVAPVPNCGFPP